MDRTASLNTNDTASPHGGWDWLQLLCYLLPKPTGYYSMTSLCKGQRTLSVWNQFIAAGTFSSQACHGTSLKFKTSKISTRSFAEILELTFMCLHGLIITSAGFKHKIRITLKNMLKKLSAVVVIGY